MSRGYQTTIKPKPRNDAYTIMLVLSLVAIIAACVMLFYDLKRYPKAPPPTPITSIR